MEVNNSIGELISSVLLSLSEEDSSLTSTSEHNGADSEHVEHTHNQNIPNTPAAATERCTNGESSNLATMSPSTSSEHFNSYHCSIAPDTYSAPLLPYQVQHQNSMQMPNGSQTSPQMPRQINYQNNMQMSNGSQTSPQMPCQIDYQNKMQMPNGSQTISQISHQINHQNSMQMPNGSQTSPQMPRQINYQNTMQIPIESQTIPQMSHPINHHNSMKMPNESQTSPQMPCQINYQNTMQMPIGSQTIPQMSHQINHQNSMQIPNGSQTIPQMSRQINNQNSMQILNGSQTIPQIPRQINLQNGMQMPNGSHIITQSGPSFTTSRQLNIQRRSQVPAPPVYHPQSWSSRSHNPIKKLKRIRTMFTTEQLLKLEKQFKANPYLERSKRLEMAGELEVGENIIKVWFQNRRMKGKKNKRQEPSSSKYDPNVLNPTISYASIGNEGFHSLNPIPTNSNNDGYGYVQNGSNGNGLYPQQILTTNGELPQIIISPEDLDNTDSDSDSL